MKTLRERVWRQARAVMVLSLLSACASVSGASKIPVTIHGVNYSNEEFSFWLDDPDNPGSKGGGELIGRFAAGGDVCCFSLPKQWQPGVKVRIHSRHWLKDAAGKLSSVEETHVVEVPQYPASGPGDLWVLRQKDGSYVAISSLYQPDHPQWPGAIKVWPVPSPEYRRERLALALKLAEDDLALSERIKAKLDKDPAAYAQGMWPLWMKSRSLDLTPYSGPEDTRLHNMLRADINEQLQDDRRRVQRLKDEIR